MTTPTSVPPAQTASETVIVVEAGPSKMERTKSFAKTLANRVGVPVLIGSAAAYVTARKLSKSEENSQLELTASTEE